MFLKLRRVLVPLRKTAADESCFGWRVESDERSAKPKCKQGRARVVGSCDIEPLRLPTHAWAIVRSHDEEVGQHGSTKGGRAPQRSVVSCPRARLLLGLPRVCRHSCRAHLRRCCLRCRFCRCVPPAVGRYGSLRFQVLVLNEGMMAGIVTPKDLLMRVLAKDLNPDETRVSDIMTPNPDTVPPEMTAVEALGEASSVSSQSLTPLFFLPSSPPLFRGAFVDTR